MNEMTNSHILVHEFDYQEPASLGEVLSLLREYGARAHVLAGGTYLLVQMKKRMFAPPPALISLRSIPELTTIEDGETLAIGAMVTLRNLLDHPVVCERFDVVFGAGPLTART